MIILEEDEVEKEVKKQFIDREVYRKEKSYYEEIKNKERIYNVRK